MKIIVLNDDGKLYCEALEYMGKVRGININDYHVHFLKMFIKGIIRMNPATIIKSISSSIFYIRSFFLKRHLIVIGIAPYDPHIFVWRHLIRNNKVVLHTSWPYWNGNDYPMKTVMPEKIVFKAWEKFIKNDNVYVSCILDKTKRELVKKYDKNRNKIHVIPHTVDTSNFYPEKTKKKRTFGVLFAGRFVEEKGLKYLVDVIKHFKNKKVRFGIAGSGRDEDLLNTVIGYKNVNYYGRINDRKSMGEIMRKYDVFFLPSYKTEKWEELFGMAIIEAMASGLVVIATDCIGPKNIINNMKDGIIIKQKDLKIMIEKIDYLINNSAKKKALSKAGIDKAKNYRIEKIAEKWRDLFEIIIGRGI